MIKRKINTLAKLLAVHAVMLLFQSAAAQENGHHSNGDYVRPAYKVFRSMSAALAQPDSVFILELKGEKLDSFPEGLDKFPNLMVLDLSRNKIRKIPPSIAHLTGLIELNLSSNKLTHLPPEIGSLTSLRKLSLNRNAITNLPAAIGKLQELRVLELWDNELATLPDEMRQLPKLATLELRGILFSDEQQKRFRELLPGVRIYMSPACDCKTN